MNFKLHEIMVDLQKTSKNHGKKHVYINKHKPYLSFHPCRRAGVASPEITSVSPSSGVAVLGCTGHTVGAAQDATLASHVLCPGEAQGGNMTPPKR